MPVGSLIDDGCRVDVNVLAFKVVKRATEEASPADKGKHEASKKGGLRGGVARARSLSPERRLEIAKRANAARWKRADQ